MERKPRRIAYADCLGVLVKTDISAPLYILNGGCMKKVALVMGSDSDLPKVKKAAEMLEYFGIPYEAHVYSAHRTPDKALEFAGSARKNGFGAIIAAAGMAAHLAGVMAAKTDLPVIGVPCSSAAFGGMDALLSTVQMPTGIPVASVAVDGAANAAVLAAEMFAIEDEALAAKLREYREQNAKKTLEKDASVAEKLSVSD